MANLPVRRAQVDALEAAIRELPGSFTGDEDNEFIQTTHYFSPGVYTRRLARKQGVVIVGKSHREACLTILVKGRLIVTSSTDDVPPGTLVEAGAMWVSRAGTKRATYALEDAVLITVHQNPNNLTDLAELEAAIILPDTQELEHME